MKNLHLITSSAHNYYFYTKSRRYLSLIPVELSRLLAGEEKEPGAGVSDSGSKQISKSWEDKAQAYPPGCVLSEDSLFPDRAYYERKLAYLKAHGIVDTTPWEHRMCGISAEDVERSLANTLQITFEVTDGCNLKCKYCGFGEMYQDYDARQGKRIRGEDALAVLGRLFELWEFPAYAAPRKVNIGFYGGEPLLNMPFIEYIVGFLESHPCASRTFDYSMTTNALLLDRYMDFLAKHKFHLLISLDGDAENSVYRVGEKGRPLFDKIIRNIDRLQAEYPVYFARSVRFNTVLHDKNSVEATYRFIKTRYGKAPRISALSLTGVRQEKQVEFDKMYKSVSFSLKHAPNRKRIVRDMFPNVPGFLDVFRFITGELSMRYSTYNDLFFDDTRPHPRYPTGVCLPFSRKLFVSVNGKLLPCERIGHQYALGTTSKERMDVAFNQVADRYNKAFRTMKKKCRHCYGLELCTSCLFEMYTPSGRLMCNSFMDEKGFADEVRAYIDYLEINVGVYRRMNYVRLL